MYLSKSLEENGIKIIRLKTGTPPRILKHSIDFTNLEIQDGEDVITPYSALTDEHYFDNIEQIPCHIV